MVQQVTQGPQLSHEVGSDSPCLCNKFWLEIIECGFSFWNAGAILSTIVGFVSWDGCIRGERLYKVGCCVKIDDSEGLVIVINHNELFEL